MLKTKALPSGLSLPLGRELPEGARPFLSLWALPVSGMGATGNLLKCLWCGCELDPRHPGPESSPPRLPCGALQKDGSTRPQQELLALQRYSKRVRRGKEGAGRRAGRLRLSQAPGRVQASGLLLSGATSPSPPPAPPPQAPGAALPLGSDSVGPDTSPGGLPWPLQGPPLDAASAYLLSLPVPFTWDTLPFLPPPPLPSGSPLSILQVRKLAVPSAIIPRSPMRHGPCLAQHPPARQHLPG